MKLLRFLVFPFVLAMLAGSLFAQEADEAAIKARMLERVDAIDQLKSEALVGENNKGLLEQRGALSPEQTELMNAENADRRALYGVLANRLGLTVAVVGEGRAESLRKISADGVWLQNPDGSWFQK